MSASIINLCSSPEPENKLSPKIPTESSYLNTTQRKQFLKPPPFDWYELSSESSGKEIADVRSTAVNAASLPIECPTIEDIYRPKDTPNELIDLVSDECDITEVGISSEPTRWLDVEQINGKKELISETDTGKATPLLCLKKSFQAEQTPNIDSFLLSDPFASSPVKNRGLSPAPYALCSKLSEKVINVNSDPISDKDCISKSITEVRGESPRLLVDSFPYYLENPDLSSSPSISSYQAGIRNELKRKLTSVISEDDDSDEAWITELVKKIEKKKEKGKGKAKISGPKKSSDISRRKKVNTLDITEQSDDSIMPKPESAKPNAKEDGIKRAQERLKQKEEKAKAKEAEKIRKIKEKEEISRKKEWEAALNKMNKLKSRLESTTEMIVDLPSCLDEKLADQVRLFLDSVKARHSTYGNSNNIIKWRRKIQAEWDPVDNRWKPVDERNEKEKHVLYAVKIQEFIELIGGLEGRDLNSFVLKLTVEFNGSKIIFLIEGLNSWFSRHKAIRNKNFADNVRNRMNNPELSILSATSSRKRTKKFDQLERIDKSKIEDALLRLQVVHNVLIHHTQNPLETAEWIMRFTQHISTIPYRKQSEAMNTANFCIETGQIDSGKDLKDTYIKMLQQMHLVTPSVAWGIESKYGNVQALIRGLEEKGPLALEHCRKSANKNGAFTDTRIGQSISRRVHSVFLSEDAWSAEI
ncbi:Crossover junction endonuclease eme1 [Erysiphe neolycopersici]|uniref:Crossover junction endonuclease eme1 n=1 Tax=Erysiphe neolycopersici TaxID=212602 RepID=A0A420I507_9PEZI|nr:Crossover junction endonuclease eme1 [Erysiphe neolycopersici]